MPRTEVLLERDPHELARGTGRKGQVDAHVRAWRWVGTKMVSTCPSGRRTAWV